MPAMPAECLQSGIAPYSNLASSLVIVPTQASAPSLPTAPVAAAPSSAAHAAPRGTSSAAHSSVAHTAPRGTRGLSSSTIGTPDRSRPQTDLLPGSSEEEELPEEPPEPPPHVALSEFHYHMRNSISAVDAGTLDRSSYAMAPPLQFYLEQAPIDWVLEPGPESFVAWPFTIKKMASGQFCLSFLRDHIAADAVVEWLRLGPLRGANGVRFRDLNVRLDRVEDYYDPPLDQAVAKVRSSGIVADHLSRNPPPRSAPWLEKADQGPEWVESYLVHKERGVFSLYMPGVGIASGAAPTCRPPPTDLSTGKLEHYKDLFVCGLGMAVGFELCLVLARVRWFVALVARGPRASFCVVRRVARFHCAVRQSLPCLVEQGESSRRSRV